MTDWKPTDFARPFGNGKIYPLEGVNDLFYVEAYFPMPAPGVWISRTMTIYRVPNTQDLYLINSCRLDEATEKQLLELGNIKGTIVISKAHGIDEPYYKSKFGGELFSVPTKSFKPAASGAPPPEFKSVYEMKVPGIEVIELVGIDKAKHEEVALYIPASKVLITCDIIQHYGERKQDAPALPLNFITGPMMSFMGFRGEAVTVPMFVRVSTTANSIKDLKPAFEAINKLDYDIIVPGHGGPCYNAKETRAKFEKSVEAQLQ
eukprot:CAMPEP_0184695814 /NCGR_PEP_ID=MMETSP0313-20130426/3332_1 /TAXON_ID=2792 /ORGANISM="Porphyridium aerugineum, Strain SAG 1380-2" /LENGTH=261 /DNA_ID=CAMNT_0027154339 /DNA_START=112 /DNA_END=897 /DNA_ORIENTATION=-